MTNLSIKNMLESSENITFGVMSSGYVFQAWQANCIHQLMRNGIIPKLLILDANAQPKKSFWQKTTNYLNRKGLYHLYQRLFFRPQAKETVDLKEQLAAVETIACKTSRKKFSEYFSDDDIKVIKNHNLSFILRFGFNIIRGEILEVARFGVWSFHHDDEQKYRGGPPGFWEIMKNDPVTAVILQRLTSKLDGGIILKKGYFKTITHSYSGQIDNLYFETSSFPLQVCKDILNGQAAYFNAAQSLTRAHVYKAPSNMEMVNFSFKLIFNKLLFHHNEVYHPEDWNIGILSKPVNEVTKNPVPTEITRLPVPPRGHYYADPFGFIQNEKLNLVFENYNYRNRKGIISRVDFAEGNFGKIQPAIAENFHLSYPFILEEEGQLFCIPETAAINQVRLYKLDQETGEFHFHRTLLEGFPAADPTIFNFGGLWWLFATHQRQSNTKLFAFYANRLFEPFVPHNNNPIKVDVRSARPAGTPFFDGKNLIRPAQDCSETYGGRVVLNRILTLNPDKFSEEEVGFLEPEKNSKYRL